uniref:MFS domain-containing protein n=1 Tax=Macrostomum lignano TaxID=282301 RepID=A0A1I8HYB7_9PLAT
PEHAAAISDFIPIVDNSSEFDTCHYRLNGSVTACSDWIFDSEQFESTIVTEYKLVCSRQKLTTILSTCTFGGLLLGRRKCLLLSVWLLTLADVAACFTVSPIYSAIAFLLVGAGILPAYTVGYVMLFELVGPKARHHVGSITAYCSAIGATVPPLIAMTT